MVYGPDGSDLGGDASVRAGLPSRLAEADPIGNVGRFVWSQTMLPRRLRSDEAALYYSPVQEGMLRPPCRQIITIHDLIPLSFPGHSPRMRHYFRHVLPALVRSSSGLAVVSAATEADVRERFDIDDRPIEIAPPPGPAPVFQPVDPDGVEVVLRRYGLRRYLLTVGTARHKNAERLIEAFSRMATTDVELAVVGPPAALAPSLESLPSAVRQRIRLIGTVDDETLAALYTGASIFVFPSLKEGFGIPPLEAMACGAPVAASSAAAVKETCGDAATYFNPHAVDEMREVLERLLDDASQRTHLRDRGSRRIGAFGVNRSAAALTRLIDAVLNG
jgi:glycosyltransferase involved in cell wall biosynthesis